MCLFSSAAIEYKVPSITGIAMIYYLPTVRSTREGWETLAQTRPKLLRVSIRMNCNSTCQSWIFFDANMAAPLGAILSRVAGRFNTIRIVDMPGSVETILRKNLFLTHYWYKSLDDNNNTTMPFRRLRLSDEGEFEEYIIGNLPEEASQNVRWRKQDLQKKVFEVYQNAVFHSESNLGVFVCGQFFPQQNRLDFTVADAGIGIRENVRRYFNNPRINSLPALKWALEPYHTTKSGPYPGGLGLEFLQKFARLNDGKIQIASRFAFYELSRGTETFANMAVDFPGTAVTIEINTADESIYFLESERKADSPY